MNMFCIHRDINNLLIILFVFSRMISIYLCLIFVPFTTAIHVTTCDCTEPTLKDVFTLEINDCLPKHKPNQLGTVNYTVLSPKKDLVKFPAYLCHRWRRQIEVSVSITFSRDTVPSTTAEDTSPEECWDMARRLSCRGEQMIRSGEKWTYEAKPEGTGYWWSTTTYTTHNCMVEEITLEKECNDCPILTPFGPVNSTEGFYSHNHNMVVWKTTWTMVSPSELSVVGTGQGILYPIDPSNNSRRLEDKENQLEFHLDLKNETAKPLFSVKGMPDIFIVYGTRLNDNIKITSKHSTGSRVRNAMNTAAHSQFIMDQETDAENVLADKINLLNCQQRRNQRLQVLLAAQYNGWLAANLLQLLFVLKYSQEGNLWSQPSVAQKM